MEVIEIQNSFGIENLTLAERPTPKPGVGEVLVKMKAASLNYRDLMMVRGHYNPRQPLPLIPCSDGAGEVIAIGKEVTRVKEGDLIATTFFQKWQSGKLTSEKAKSTLGGPMDGTLSQYMVLGENGVMAVPGHLSAQEAATLPCAALTAWNALVVNGKVKAGDKVLIQGTGGVALFALQFAAMMGAEIAITSSSDEKLERAKKMGATHCINYKRTPKWGKEVKKSTGGVDIVIELGGASTLPETFYTCRPGATIALIGVLSGIVADLDIIPIIMQNLRVQGIFVGTGEQFADMNRAIALHGLKPIVDRVFPLEEARRAFEHMRAGAHFGKICIAI